jgi:D-xylose transport system substrate-binding protein
MHLRRLLAVGSMITVLAGGCGSGAGQARPTTAATVAGGSPAAVAATRQGCMVGVSWADATGRWQHWDEPAIRAAVVDAGGTYISNDAVSSPDTQASNVDGLIAQGATVLIIVAQDKTAIEPVVTAAIGRGIPVIAYDRLIEDPAALYVTFDNVEVGRMQAKALLAVAPKGNYLFIKGDKADANSDLLRAGQAEILGGAMTAGDIVNVGESYIKNWNGGLAQSQTELFLAANGNRVDAVLAENDGMAEGVIAALDAVHLAGITAVSGQDGSGDALNAVARGTQTVDVWKDARALGAAAGKAAVELCRGASVDTVSGTAAFLTPSGKTMRSILIDPIAITRANLDVVVDADWISQEDLCADVAPGSAAACG